MNWQKQAQNSGYRARASEINESSIQKIGRVVLSNMGRNSSVSVISPYFQNINNAQSSITYMGANGEYNTQ